MKRAGIDALLVLGRVLLRLPALALLATTLVCFAPGLTSDERSLDLRLNSETVEEIRQASRPNPIQLVARYFDRALAGDLGTSTALGSPVLDLLAERAPTTLSACALGVLAGWSGAVLICFITNLARSRALGILSLALSTALLCIPSVLVGLAAVYSSAPLALAMAVVVFPRVYQYVSRVLDDASRAPFMLTARASGISEWRAFRAHLLPPVKPELFAVLGVSVATVLGASVPLEVITDFPGLGQLAWKATMARDFALLLSVTLLMAVVVTISTACTDLAAVFARRDTA